MYSGDAETSREIAEAAKEREAANDFLQSVMYDINTEAQLGNKSTTYHVAKTDERFIDGIVEALEVRDYVVKIKTENGRKALNISWH